MQPNTDFKAIDRPRKKAEENDNVNPEKQNVECFASDLRLLARSFSADLEEKVA